MYARRKRPKPVQKAIKPSQSDGTKSNPSKRHRDRLNTELDRLADLLPFSQDIITKLDKLSVLRLSVSYLRAKGFFEVALKSRTDANGNPKEKRSKTSKPSENLSLLEGELLLQAINGFVLVVTSDGLVFYTSSTIQDYLGFQQSDVIHQSVFELIHTEDRLEFQRQLHWALDPAQSTEAVQSEGDKEFVHPSSYYDPDQLPPENSSFMERNFICRMRCLLDNSSGFLTMNFQGRLKFLHGQNQKRKDGSTIPPQLALFTLATPLQSPSILEIRTKNLIFRTKHKLDFTPIGCDAKGSIVLGYTEAELCVRGTGYQFIHAADMLYCADNHVRMIKTGESGMTVFRLLTKDSGWTWVQANARLVYKNGRPDYIIATQRPLTEEEGAEHLRKRNLQVPFMFATGEAVLYEVTFPMASMTDPMEMKAKSKMAKGSATKPSSRTDSTVDPASLLGAMLRQDESVYICPPAAKRFSFENFLSEAKDELSSILSSDWQQHIIPVANRNVLKQEKIDSPVISNPIAAQGSADLFTDNKNIELYNIMKSLGMDFDDLEFIQQDDTFFKAEFDSSDIGDIDLTDEILTYVQESLNKRPDCMYSSSMQQQASTEGIVQQAPETQPPQQFCQRQTVPPQLCQKMKHMQVNGRLTNWNVVNSVPVAYQQTLPEQYDFSKFQNINTDFPFKSEATDTHATCAQNFMPFQQSASIVPPPMNFADLNFFAENVPASEYPISSNIDAHLNCLPQNSQSQSCGINPQPLLLTSQPCYAGAASVYPCIPEMETACLNPSLYNPMVEDQQPVVNDFQNGFSGGSFMEQYPPQLNIIHSTQNTKPFPPPNHRTDPRPYTDMAQSGFM